MNVYTTKIEYIFLKILFDVCSLLIHANNFKLGLRISF